MSFSKPLRFLIPALSEIILLLPIIGNLASHPSSQQPQPIIQAVVSLENPRLNLAPASFKVQPGLTHFADLLENSSLSSPALVFASTPEANSGDVLGVTKYSYTVAIIGDSMIDTMGEDLPYLKESLAEKLPSFNFKLYNYGTGAQNVEEGLARFSQSFNYQTRHFPPLPELKPDIIIVGSFSYNPFSPHNRDKHWLNLASLVQEAQKISNQVFLLAEIAPLRSRFGQGPNGVNWSEDGAFTHSSRINEQLENTVGLAQTLNVPLVNAFNPSLANELKEGNPQYVNPGDGIHPSVSGHQFIANLIANKLSAQIKEI